MGHVVHGAVQHGLGVIDGRAGGVGGPVFNFMGMAKDGEAQKTMRLKEIKNGRLAMIACFGFGAQAVLTGKGPVENLTDHLSSPFSENMLANFGKIYGN